MIAWGDHSRITWTPSTNLLLSFFNNTAIHWQATVIQIFWGCQSLIHGSTRTESASHDIAQYKAIPWFMKDMDNRQLLEEWSIYANSGGFASIHDCRPRFWGNGTFRHNNMPILERQNWYAHIKFYAVTFYAVSKNESVLATFWQ